MSDRLKLFVTAILALALLCLAYSNHFDNGFHFDDSHTIVQNTAIRDIRNVPEFFIDGRTSSALPQNQAYRPLSTALNAFDYWLGGGLEPFYFHISIFVAYLVQLVLLFVLYRSVLDQAEPHPRNALVALLITAFYGLHTANAETINYIGARTDSFSTLLVVASLLLYRWRITRRLQLHIVAMVLGIYTKQSALMLAPLLFLYILFFDPERSEEAGRSGWPSRLRLRRALMGSAPAFLAGTALLALNQLFLTPATTVSSNTSVSRLDYLLTQAHIVTHYLGNFLLPLDLSADPDFTVITSLLDPRILYGLLVCVALLGVSLYASRRRALRPIAFGILWFFIALAPTSSLVPLFQVANDHRTFFPYIGLALSVGWALELLLRRRAPNAPPIARLAIASALLLVLVAHAYGVHRRNIVWSSDESLWLDVTQKSPKNGRGLMNYGLTQMTQGKYEVAYDYYQRALEIVPYYAYLHANLGIVLDAMERQEEAQQHFRNALRYGPGIPSTYYYYGRWLRDQGRSDEALAMLEKAAELGPTSAKIQSLLPKLAAEVARNAALSLDAQEQGIRKSPSAEGYINLGLSHYRAGRFREATAAWQEAAELAPASAVVYNNLCSAYVKLDQPRRAIRACERALTLDPEFERAKANLGWARQAQVAAQKDGAAW